MAKINAEGVVSDATLSETPEPVEPDDLTPRPEEAKPKAVPIEKEAKPVKRTAGRKNG